MTGNPLNGGGAGEVCHLRMTLPRGPEAGRAFRNAVSGCSLDVGLSPDRPDLARLLGSEVVDDAVLHGTAPVEVAMTTEGRFLTLEVGDRNPVHPVVRTALPVALNGWGMRLVAAFADSWGVRDTLTGKTVWYRFPGGREAAGSDRSYQRAPAA